jgi:hypothetical protein
MIPHASATVLAGFIVLPLLVAAMFVFAFAWATRRSRTDATTSGRALGRVIVGCVAWLIITALLARSGVLARFDLRPPPFGMLVLALIGLALAVAFSGVGSRLVRTLPLWALVASQVFRFPLELLMHKAYAEGLMPVQMSYSGYNFDIVTGITAGALGAWLFVGRPPNWIVALWNLLGSLLLANIIAIAVLSTPVFRAFGDKQVNVFVAYFPFVWLPAVLVTAALIGHLLVWRRLTAREIVQTS